MLQGQVMMSSSDTWATVPLVSEMVRTRATSLAEVLWTCACKQLDLTGGGILLTPDPSCWQCGRQAHAQSYAALPVATEHTCPLPTHLPTALPPVQCPPTCPVPAHLPPPPEAKRSIKMGWASCQGASKPVGSFYQCRRDLWDSLKRGHEFICKLICIQSSYANTFAMKACEGNHLLIRTVP